MATSVVLARKLYVGGDARERTLRGLGGLLEDRIGDLEADVEIVVREDDFPVVTLSGPDETAAGNVLAEEFGEIPVPDSGAEVPDASPPEDPTAPFEPGETYTGTLEHWDDDGFLLDAGRSVRIPTEAIGLGPGDPEQLVERFGLVQHLPMQFTVPGGEAGESADGEGERERRTTTHDGAVRAALADAERDRLFEWQRGPGRVTVNSATRSEVRATVNRAGHAQDIVTVERLGLLEHSIVCKEGTDPPGLIAAIGEYLPAELRAVV